MVQFLISKGAAVNAPDVDGNTPLHLSMKGGSPLAVKTLLSSGADMGIENAKGQVAAKFSGSHPACRQALEAGGHSFGGMSGP